MSEEHTKGRLKSRATDLVQETGRYRMASRITACGAGGNMQQDVYAAIANARRLAACWNACEGMSTDSLENILMLGDTMRSRFVALKSECDSAHKENDAARALLREVLEADEEAIADAEAVGFEFPSELIALTERVRAYLDASNKQGEKQ